MIRIIIYILFIFATLKTSAQAPTTVVRQTTVPNLRAENYGTEFSITDANGRPFQSTYLDVQGSPYFLDSLKSALIVFTNGNRFTQIPARLDLYRQEIHVISKNNEEFILPKELVRELIITDSSPNKFEQYVFRSGFPAIDGQSSNSFYLLLADGNVTMLKFFRKKILQRTNDVSGEVTKEFETYEEYYVFSDNQIMKLKKDKEFVLSLFKNKEQEIQSYLNSNRINFKKWNDIQSLFSYYNSIIGK